MIKLVVPISGGKDSECCLKKAIELYDKDEIFGLFCDTGFEHPLTYAYVDDMQAHYGVHIMRVKRGNVADEVRKRGNFPSAAIRFCTSELKIKPSRDFYLALYKFQKQPFEVWLGVRKAESKERAARYAGRISDETYLPNDVNREFPKRLGTHGVMFRFPIVDWTDEQVFDYLGERRNPLYDQGFDRVGCFPCLASGKANQIKAMTHDAFGRSQRLLIKQLEDEIGIKHGPAKTDFLCGLCHY